MAIRFVKAVLFQENGIPLYACPKVENVPCGNIEVRGVEWWIPIVREGRLVGYDRFLGNSPADSPLPSPGAVKTLRIVNLDNSDTMWVLINTNDDETSFVNNCNGCCGDTPVMAAVTLPVPITENCVCIDEDGNYVHNIPIPANANSLNYNIITPTANGVVVTPALSGSGYTTPANLLSAVNTNWSALGTFSLQASNKILRLVSTTVSCLGMEVQLLAKSYCLTLPAADAALPVNGIKFGTTVVSFPTITVSVSNPQDLINAIRPFLVGTLVAAGTGPKIQYTGLQKPVEIDYNGTLQTGMTFANGVCS